MLEELENPLMHLNHPGKILIFLIFIPKIVQYSKKNVTKMCTTAVLEWLKFYQQKPRKIYTTSPDSAQFVF
jgi:hypothetical protein